MKTTKDTATTTMRVVVARTTFHAPTITVIEHTLWDAAHPIVLANPSLFVPVVLRATSDATPITTATDTTVVATPGANQKIRVHRIYAANAGATATIIGWRDDTAGARCYGQYLAQGSVQSLKLEGSWDLTTNKPFVLYTSATGSIHWTVDYEVMPA